MTSTDNNLTPTSSSNWKGRRSGTAIPVQVPSGNVALCRRPGIDVFMRLGMIPNGLLKIVQQHIGKAKGGKPVEIDVDKELKKLLDDPEKLKEIVEFTDVVVAFICIEPEIKLPPQDPKERDPETFYADEVDLQDKMFLLQWAVGGLEDIESFREEARAFMGSVLDQQGVESTTV